MDAKWDLFLDHPWDECTKCLRRDCEGGVEGDAEADVLFAIFAAPVLDALLRFLQE